MNKDSHTIQQQLGTSEKDGNMPQCVYLMHNKRMNPTSSINYLQLINNPLVHLRNTPQMEPRIMKTVNELNNAPLELISSQHTPLGISDR